MVSERRCDRNQGADGVIYWSGTLLCVQQLWFQLIKLCEARITLRWHRCARRCSVNLPATNLKLHKGQRGILEGLYFLVAYICSMFKVMCFKIVTLSSCQSSLGALKVLLVFAESVTAQNDLLTQVLRATIVYCHCYYVSNVGCLKNLLFKFYILKNIYFLRFI